jgi:drug/metabolite transporter (DMT)-like permease
MGSGHAAIIVYTMPVWTAVLSPFFLTETITVRKFIALVLGMTGVAVLLSSDFDALGTNPVGMIFLLTAAVGWAIGTIVVKRTAWPIGMYALAGWQLLIGMVPIAIIAVLTEDFTMFEASERALWAAGYVTFFAVIAGYALWFSIVRVMPATVASIGTLVVPVLGVFSGALALSEPLGWREFAATALVLTAVALVAFQRQRQTPSD